MAEFKHSGNAGDIIYILPTIAAQPNGPHVLYLNPDRPAEYAAGITHPSGGVMLTEATAQMLIPLVEALGIACKIWQGEEFDYDLDAFREHRLNLSAYDIRRWIMAEYPELRPAGPFYGDEVTPNRGSGDYITVNLSSRYRQLAAGGEDKWRMLEDQPWPVHFIGVEAEYIAFKKLVPKAYNRQVRDFLHMAEVMAEGLYHFGNQSSPFAIAEIFDLPRALEISPYCPNVVSEGNNWQPIFNADNFRWCVEQLPKP